MREYKEWRVCFDRKKGKYVMRYFFKTPFLAREKAAYLKLRRLGLSINQLSAAFGRSTSVIHRILKKLQRRGILRFVDIRKLPLKARQLMSSLRWNLLMKLLPRWISWILEETEKPP